MNKKRNIILALALMLSTVLITGLTFAYLSAKTGPKTNTFTIGGVSIQLAEPNFDGRDYNNVVVTPAAGTQLGEVSALNIMPGRIIAKDPSVKNTSNPSAVWVAIKLDYTISGTPGVYDSATLTNELSAFAGIDFDTVAWEMKAGSDYTVFYYRTAVSSGLTTSNLFNNVTIKKEATALKPFSIDVKAYAVQAEGLTYETAKIQLDSIIAQP